MIGGAGRPEALLVNPMGSNDPSTPSKASKPPEQVPDCTTSSSFRMNGLSCGA